MIKAKISSSFPNHILKYRFSSDNIFIADYTEQTKLDLVKRGIEVFTSTAPTDINSFSIINTTSLEIGFIDFDNSSFVCANGNAKSQCECVLFPSVSNVHSWILFCELKYSSNPIKNQRNLVKAIKQLYKTRYYYYQNNVIKQSNISYLIGSLPLQSEPFTNFYITPNFLVDLKRKRNIVLRFKNNVEIRDDIQILV